MILRSSGYSKIFLGWDPLGCTTVVVSFELWWDSGCPVVVVDSPCLPTELYMRESNVVLQKIALLIEEKNKNQTLMLGDIRNQHTEK